MNIEQLMDPEIKVVFATIPDLGDLTRDLAATRRMVVEMSAAARVQLPRNDQITIEDRIIPGPKEAPNVPVRIYAPSTRTGALPGLLWMHGGSFMWGIPEQDDAFCQRIVEQVGCVVVSVDYRLAPENPFPAGVEDCYAALHWMAASAADLGIDAGHIAIGGTSAGGCLAAAVALMARDRRGPALAFQLLIYPCFDDRLTTLSSHAITDGRTVNRQLLLKSWAAYLGGDPQSEVSPQAAPARATNLSGLPPTYVGVAELDPLRDEAIAYTMRLMQAGVTTELHVFPGTIHGFEVVVPTAAVSRRAVAEYIEALGRALSR
jgi:acetyl esterase/lipase